MRTLVGSMLAALLVFGGSALADEPADVIVVTAKKPPSMLSDMTDEIVAETAAELRADPKPVAAPDVRVELGALKIDRG